MSSKRKAEPDALPAGEAFASEPELSPGGDSPAPIFFGASATLRELEQAARVRVRTRDPHSGGVYAGGELITPDARELSMQRVRERGRSHVAQLALHPLIFVEVLA